MFTVAGLFPLNPVMLLMPCHMLIALLVLNCYSILFLYCRLAALMDFLRSYLACFRSSMFPDLKADVRTDKAARTSLLPHGFWLG